MLDQLLQLVQGSAQEDIVDNPEVPNNHNQEAIGLTTSAVAGGLQSALASGGFKQVLDMFSGQSGLTNNPITNNISNDLVKSLSDKLGINSQAASGIAASLIPKVLGSLINKTQDPNNNSFTLDGLVKGLSGGDAGGGSALGGLNLQGMLQKAMSGGLDKDGDGDVDLQDVIGMVTGAASGAGQQGNGSSAGGIMDTIKGFFK